MKQISFFYTLVVTVFFLPVNLNAQTNTVAFNYDDGGNMIERKVQVFPGFRIAGAFQKDRIFNQVTFNIFPNPTNDYLNIEGELPENITEAGVSLLNISGQVLRTDVYNGQSKQLIVSDLRQGLYLLEIKYSKDEKSTYKIIITN